MNSLAYMLRAKQGWDITKINNIIKILTSAKENYRFSKWIENLKLMWQAQTAKPSTDKVYFVKQNAKSDDAEQDEYVNKYLEDQWRKHNHPVG